MSRVDPLFIIHLAGESATRWTPPGSRHVELRTELDEWEHCHSSGGVVPIATMHLVETWNARSRREIVDGSPDVPLTRLAFDRKLGTAVAKDDEVDLALVSITQEPELHQMALCVLDVVAVLEQLAGDEVLEPRTRLVDRRPVPQVKLPLLLHGSDARNSER